MSEERFWRYVEVEALEFVEWVKCGETLFSVTPTLIWTAGAAAIAHRLLSTLFRRFLFRRVPIWEVILMHLLFLWTVIYSVHFWVLLVRILKLFIAYCYEDNESLYPEDLDSRKSMQQLVIWLCGMIPLALYIDTRPRPDHPPLMIWITTNPWQRREMGPYGYYLTRPLSSLQPSDHASRRQKVLSARRAFSDSKIVIKQPASKKRYSKSI